jgi:hypothetical protein
VLENLSNFVGQSLHRPVGDTFFVVVRAEHGEIQALGIDEGHRLDLCESTYL